MEDSAVNELPTECAIRPTLKRIDNLVERVCLPIELSDPGRILSLLRSLFENSSDILQIKINKYLAEVTKSAAAFLIISFLRNNEFKVAVMGQQILPTHIYLDRDSELVQSLVAMDKGAVEISLDCLDDKFRTIIQNHLDEVGKEKGLTLLLNSLLAVPVQHPVSTRTLLHVILINAQREVDYKRINAGLVSECIRYCLGTLINAVCYEEERREHERARNFIHVIKEMLLHIEDTENMMSELRVRICDLFDCERCNIFLRDQCTGFITKILHFGVSCEFAEEPLEDVKLPEDFGLVGIVGKTGEIINCEDTQQDSRYCLDLDIKAGISTRNALCFPLRRENGIVGAVEVYNKLQSKESDSFSQDDVRVAEALSVLLTPLIFHSLNFRKVKELCNRNTATDLIFLQRAPPSDEEVEEVMLCQVAHDYEEILHLGYSQLKFVLDPHLFCLIYDSFNKLGLIKRFNILPLAMIRFILSVFKEHPAFPLHNWKLSFGSFHFATVLVNELNLVNDGILTHIEILALLISALCHMADYRGALSIFQVTCGATLGALYSTPAHINQQFQSSQILRLLHQTDTNILENLPLEQYTVFSRLFKKLVNVADIGCYMERFNSMMESLKNPLNKDDLQQRLDLLSLLMGCCVLSDYSKEFSHCRRIAEMSYAEFMPEVDRSAAEGVFDLTQFSHSIELIPPLQIQFISTICIPSFRLLSELFPVTYQCYQRCEVNLETWEKYKDKFKELNEQEQAELFMQAEVPPEPE